MAFNWPRFLKAHNIEWVDKGPSTTKDNIATRCPWCGQGDPSHHLAISIDGKGYRCFRVKSHRGRSVPRLIAALLNCSWPEALRLAGVPSISTDITEHDLGRRMAMLVNGASKTNGDAKRLKLLPEFRPVTDWGAGRYFVDYLIEKRGYEALDIPRLTKTYNLQCTIHGLFRWRLIFPITMGGVLVNWTGRTLSGNDGLRYRTLSANPEKAKESGLPVATRSIEKTLFNYDNLLNGGRELLITEGPFDAMRLDYFGAPFGIRATCTYTKSISSDQIALLDGLRELYDDFTRVLDLDAQLDLLYEQQRMAHLDVGTKRMPPGFGDPAELTKAAALEFLNV